MENHTTSPNQRLSKPTCPACQGTVDRVRRSLLDRLRGLFVPRQHVLYRYHCCALACGWTGSLERKLKLSGRSRYGPTGSNRRRVLDAARMTGMST